MLIEKISTGKTTTVILQTPRLTTDNSVEVSDQELKTRIRYLINQNKMLNLEVDELNTKLSNYTGKYHKYLELSQEWGFRVGDRFDEFKKKVNTLLNGM